MHVILDKSATRPARLGRLIEVDLYQKTYYSDEQKFDARACIARGDSASLTHVHFVLVLLKVVEMVMRVEFRKKNWANHQKTDGIDVLEIQEYVVMAAENHWPILMVNLEKFGAQNDYIVM